MKILTITLQCTDNSGSTLQAYALQQFLFSNNFNTEIINYRPIYLFKYGNPIKRIFKNILFYKSMKSRKIKVSAFEQRYLKETNEIYYSYNELKVKPPEADIYITGSDQVWNTNYKCGKDDAYYLKFVPQGKKKISYAASIGKNPVSTQDINYIYERIKDLNFISVREKSSQVTILNKGIQNIDYVCDPVFLLNPNKYRKLEIKPRKEKYIVVYLVKPNNILNILLKKLKKELKCKIILIYGTKKNCICDEHIRDIDPSEFLTYIDNAEFVVASSFHAMAFSHIFKKNFAIILPNQNSARIEQFLEVTGLTNRIVKKENDIINIIKPINYSLVEPKLNKFVNESKKFLLNSILS